MTALPYTAAFKPTSLPGCSFWIDAADTSSQSMILSGNNVTTWKDKSGNGVILTTNGTPTYNSSQYGAGLGGVVFNAGPYFQNTSFSLNLANRSIFIVANGTGGNEGILALTYTTVDYNNVGSLVYCDGGNKVVVLTENYPTGPNATYTSPTAPIMTSDSSTSSNISFWGNGNIQGTYTFSPTTSTGIIIGARNDGGGVLVNKPLTGSINEIIIYSPALTTAQRQQVEGYLAAKWGLQSSLPSFTTPTSITGCGIWLDAADASSSSMTFSSGSTLSAWKDKSVNGATFTVTGTPMLSQYNGRAAIYLNGSSYFINTTLSCPVANHSFFVVVQSSQHTNQGILCFNTTASGVYDYDSLNAFEMATASPFEYSIKYTSGYFVNTPSLPSSGSMDYSIYGDTVTTSPATGNFWVNGTNVYSATSSAAFTTSTGLVIGARANGGGISGILTGYMSEIIVYTTALTTTQRQQVEGYLAWKWGLQSSLPTNHPYYAVSPTHPYATTAPTGSNALGITRAPAVAAIVPIPKQAMTALSYNATITPVTAATGIQLWLDASDTATTTVVAGKLTAWTDKSGKGCAVTVPATTVTYKSAFLNGRATLGFAGNANITTTIPTPPGNGDYAVIAVWKPYSGGTYAAITMGPASASPSLGLGYNGSYYNLFEWGQAESDYTAAAGSYVIQIGTRVGGVKTCYINGTAAPTGTGTLQNITNGSVSIGGGDGFYITGEIAEIIIYTGTLTTSQRQVLEGVLAAKWGLQASLPRFTGPTSITGCVAWFDAYDASYTTTGNTVTGWTNKTGGGNAVTGGGTVSINQATLNGKSSVRFPPGTNYLNTTLTFATNLRCTFYVMRSGSSTVNMSAIIFLTTVDTVGPQLYSYNPNDSEIEYNKNNGSILRVLNPVNYFDTTNFTSICTTTGNTGIWTNGSSQILIGNNIISNSWDTGSSTLTIGGHYQFSLATNTDIYELIQYDGTITTAQRQQLEGYLAWKWGLQAQLPTDHPYYISSPNHPYATTAPVGASLRAPAVAAAVPTPTKALTAIVKPIYSLTLANAGSNDAFVVKYKSTGSLLWAARIASTGDDRGVRVRTDTAGNLYALGYTGGTATLYNTDGSTYGTIAASTYLIKYSAAGIIQWVSRISGGTPYDIAVDSVNNVIYVCGKGSSLTFYNAAGTAVINYTLTLASVPGYIAKYDSSGTPLWASYMGATTGSAGYSTQNNGICISPDGTSVYVTGTWSGSALAFYNSDQSTGLLTAWGGGLFLAKYNSSGFYQWGCQVVGYRDNYGIKITCDSSYIYLLVYYRAGFLRMYDVDGTFRIILDSQSNGKNNIGVVSYNTSGYAQWSASTRGTGGGNEFSYDITVDSSSNIYIIGTYNTQSVNVYNSKSTGSETLYNTYTNAGSDDTIIVKYNSSGTPQWVVTIGGTLADIGYAISFSASGNIIVAGTTTSASLTFTNSDGSSGRTLTNSSGVQNMWLASYTAAGFINWASMMTVTAASQIAGAALSTDGSAYITGYMGTGGATFGFGR